MDALTTREDVLALVESGASYGEIETRLGIRAGLAYMIATGLPADGSDALTAAELDRPGALSTTTQHLANPVPVRNPTHHEEVDRFIEQRLRADPQMQRAAAKHGPMPPPLGDTGDDADVTAVIARDHNHVHKLTQRLKTIPTAAKGGTNEDIAKRAGVIEALRVALTHHEAAEERYLWPFVRERFANGDAVADAARRQEAEGRNTLAALANADARSEEFEQLVTQLEHQLRKHVAFEDRVLLSIRDTISHDERVALGEQLARSERNGERAS